MIDLEHVHNLTMFELADCISVDEKKGLQQIIAEDLIAFKYSEDLRREIIPILPVADQFIKKNPPELILRKIKMRLRKKRR